VTLLANRSSCAAKAQNKDSRGRDLSWRPISYDSPAILKDFAERKIEFPLLADPNSESFVRFNVLNPEAKGMTKGMAYPDFFYVDSAVLFAKSIHGEVHGSI